jgi:Terminase small subunit
MADGPKKYPRKSEAAKKREAKKPLTVRQSRFARAFMKSRTLGEAAIKAGYSPKHARKCGHQALQALRNKNVPEIMSELGLSVPVLIDEYLRPLLKATETKFAQDDPKFSDYIDVENLDVRDRALDKAFRLYGAYAPKDPKEAAQFGIKVVIIDVPRPQHGTFMADVGPAKLPPSGSNGHKPQE